MRETKTSVFELIAGMIDHFGPGVRSQWFYDERLCPCCRERPLEPSSGKPSRKQSINGFFHRARSTFIGYRLCSQCAPRVMREANAGPLHRAIETNLVDAYDRYMVRCDS